MKKIFTSVLVAVLMFMTSFGGVSALTYDESFAAAKEYYAKKTVLQGADEVIAYEALGLESDSLPMEYVVDTQYASSIAKTVIALVLHGDDPRNYKGVNYVEMLENCVQDNGAFDKVNSTTYANYQIYGVYALYVVHSSQAELAADYLVSLADANHAWGYGKDSSCDLTGWVIEALSLVNKTKYLSTIENAITYIQSKQEESGGYNDAIYDYYTANANTQACVLMGLLTYDAEGVKSNKYNKGSNNPYDFLLTYQNNDGSFWYGSAGVDNYFATIQGVQAVGYYYQGSVYKTAYANYDKLLNPNIEKDDLVQEESKNEPVQEKPAQEESKNEPVQEILAQGEPKDETKKVVETSDTYSLLGYTGFMIVGAIGFLKGRRYFGEN